MWIDSASVRRPIPEAAQATFPHTGARARGGARTIASLDIQHTAALAPVAALLRWSPTMVVHHSFPTRRQPLRVSDHTERLKGSCCARVDTEGQVDAEVADTRAETL
jgi:hypothetical protein